MQQVSREYKDLMKHRWIDKLCHMRATIGVINQKAQSSIAVASTEDCEYYSNFYKPLNNFRVEELYAACDANYTRVDDNMCFLPRNRDMAVLNQGIVTQALKGIICFAFPEPYDIKGLTIEFGEAYPIDFLIEYDTGAVEIAENKTGSFTTETVFEHVTFLRIVPKKMRYEDNRFRIHQITTGIGIYFSGHEIKSATKKEYISPIDEELPTVDFTLTVENRERRFDIENDKSSVNFLEEGQEIEILYGQELDSGATEWILGGNLILSDWSVDDDEMTFSATDRLARMNETYYRGKYHSEGISLYELALDVLRDAGIDLRNVWIDPYLKEVLVNNPIPPVKHKEALQIIANAGRCVLMQGRNGNIYLKSSFKANLAAESEDEAYYSDVSAILDGTVKAEYASVSLDYTKEDCGLYFLPRAEADEIYLNTGFVSEQISDESGRFKKNPKVTIRAEAAYKNFGMTLEFGKTCPKTLKIQAYYEENLQEEVIVADIGRRTIINHEFPEWDKITLEFTEASPFNRIVLNSITFGEGTDYVLEYGCELTKSPKGTQLQKVKEVQIIRTMYDQRQEADVELAREKITVTSADNQYTLYFNTPSYGLSCAILEPQKGQSIQIVDQSCYFATVELSGVTGAAEVVINGREYTPAYAKVTRRLNISGEYEVYENPLVSEVIHAANLADWIGDYLKYDKEYSLEYRGEPRIDGNDLAYLESKYIPDMKIRISEHTLIYDGGLSGTITARRVE